MTEADLIGYESEYDHIINMYHFSFYALSTL